MIIKTVYEANGYCLKMKFIIETFCAKPTYLGIKLERALTFRRHFDSQRKKLTTRVGLLRRLAGSNLQMLACAESAVAKYF